MVIKHDAPGRANNLYGYETSSAEVQNNPTAERDGMLIPTQDETGYKIKEQPYGTRREVKVVLMGAGASTLNFLKQAEEHMSNLRITVYEKNSDVGGTWLENRYPGCACDIPSVNYQFSWAIKLWTHFYSYSPEIWEYLKGLYERGDFIEKYVKLRHQIEHAEWDEDAGQWVLQVKDVMSEKKFEDRAEFFINA